MDLTIDSYDILVETCRRYVPGATVRPSRMPTEPFEVQGGNATLRVWFLLNEDDANWSYELVRDGVEEDQHYILSVEDWTVVLYQAFGPVVLPALLVDVLAADAKDVDAPSVMEAARAVLALPVSTAWTAGATNDLRHAAIAAAQARGLHASGSLVLAAVSMVTPKLGQDWKRPVITAGPWSPENDTL